MSNDVIHNGTDAGITQFSFFSGKQNDNISTLIRKHTTFFDKKHDIPTLIKKASQITPAVTGSVPIAGLQPKNKSLVIEKQVHHGIERVTKIPTYGKRVNIFLFFFQHSHALVSHRI